MMAQAPIDINAAVTCLVNTEPYLRKAYEGLITDWAPDAPPVTIVFSALGRSLCRHASTSAEADLIDTFAVIEDLMNRGSEAVKDAVTTGLLETILAESSAGRFDMSSIGRLLGPATKAYCQAWDSFTGTTTLGLSERPGDPL